MGQSATKASRTEEQAFRDRDTAATSNHHIIAVEFLPEERVGSESLHVRFDPSIPMAHRVQDDNARQAFLNKRKQHDAHFFKLSSVGTPESTVSSCKSPVTRA